MNIEKKDSVFSPFILAILLVVLIFLLSTLYAPKPNAIQLHFLDVGQGDATLITTPANQNILIDGGPNDAVSAKLDKYLPFYHRSLDVVILSHPHADHLDGLLKVLDQFEVKKIYLTGAIHTTPEYLEFLQKIKDKRIESKAVINGDQIDFGSDIKIDFLYPFTNLTGQKVENLNNSSIVNKLIWGKEIVLFTGDAEEEEQSEILAKNVDLSADLLKVPHHGSKNGADESFFKAINPKYAIISVGKDNKFGHPSREALNLLNNVTVYRTDYDGDINFEMTRDQILPKK